MLQHCCVELLKDDLSYESSPWPPPRLLKQPPPCAPHMSVVLRAPLVHVYHSDGRFATAHPPRTAIWEPAAAESVYRRDTDHV
jgi:hypothetical protein